MSRKRKNELDELLRDAVKFMEWPTGGGPTSARIELPDDFPVDDMSMTSSSESEEGEKVGEGFSTSSQTQREREEKAEAKEQRRQLRREKREKRQKRVGDFYVPDKPLSPDSEDIENPGKEEYTVSKIKAGNNAIYMSSVVTATPASQSREKHTGRLNLLSLVQETSFGKKDVSLTANVTSRENFTVHVPGGITEIKSNHYMHHEHVKLHSNDQPGPVVTPSVSPRGFDSLMPPTLARHPLLSYTGQRADSLGTPLIRGFLMGLPSRRY